MFGVTLGMTVITRIVIKGRAGTTRLIATAFTFIQLIACANSA